MIAKTTRQGFGNAIMDLAEKMNFNILSADIHESLSLKPFVEKYPKRHIECGVSEQNMITVAAGIQIATKCPVVAGTFAEFLPMRCLDQIRVSVLHNNLNVKLVGGHSGLSYGGDGRVIQTFEDVGILKSFPNLTIYVPKNYDDAYELTFKMMHLSTPVYMRLTRDDGDELEFSEPNVDNYFDCVLISMGPVFREVEKAKRILRSHGLRTNSISVNSLNQNDMGYLGRLLASYKSIVTVEEHSPKTGLATSIKELLPTSYPQKFMTIGINEYGMSGERFELLNYYGLSGEKIAHKVLANL